MKKSILTKKQVKTFSKQIGPRCMMYVKVRYDDKCGNGHNTFAITVDVYNSLTSKADRYFKMGGCIHDGIEKHFPELAHLIKWHLCSSDGPMHYIACTLYHADEHGATDGWLYYSDERAGVRDKCLKYDSLEKLNALSRDNPNYRVKVDEKTAKIANIEAARNCAVWPDATLAQLQDRKQLEARLPALLEQFRADVEAFGFTW